ncbi:sodium:calcium antiporter [Pinisolibacter sp.]|uniref:sodium:calcium antiporter n=1 Tax=Pinisolibacter sp. TaxID=2172024 RepID=UPI002FDEE5A6
MLETSIEVAAVVAAVLLAAIGGELFLTGVLGTAKTLRLPRGLVATTLGAAATSAPELFVSVVAAGSGRPEIGLGDTLGSNVVNIALVLGLVLLHRSVTAGTTERTTAAAALIAPFVLFVLLLDGRLERWEGGLLLALFVAWAIVGFHTGRRRHTAEVEEMAALPRRSMGMAAAYLAVGVMMLVGAGRLFVFGAVGLATRFGIDDYVIGATVVAIGTSLPELTTVVASRRRGHDDIGLGTLLGSNLFNGLAIVGVAATITPIVVPVAEVGIALAFGWVSMILVLPRGRVVPRSRGALLLAVYVAYVLATLAVTIAEAV